MFFIFFLFFFLLIFVSILKYASDIAGCATAFWMTQSCLCHYLYPKDYELPQGCIKNFKS